MQKAMKKAASVRQHRDGNGQKDRNPNKIIIAQNQNKWQEEGEGHVYL